MLKDYMEFMDDTGNRDHTNVLENPDDPGK
jgi:hypothetical protein